MPVITPSNDPIASTTNLARLEAKVFSHWQNRLQTHAQSVVEELFGPVSRWPGRRLRWNLREWSRASALKDELARTGQDEGLFQHLPHGRVLGLRIQRGGDLVGYIHAEFLFDLVAVVRGENRLPTPADASATTARVESALGIPCYCAFAGVFGDREIHPSDRTLLLDWQVDSSGWQYREGQHTAPLWQLFHLQTDQELSQRIEAALALRDPRLMRLEELRSITGLNEHQVQTLAGDIPGARLISSQGMRLIELLPCDMPPAGGKGRWKYKS